MLAPPEPGAGPLRPRTTVSAETARLRWKWHFAALRFEAALRNHLRALKAYDPNQPRVPAGSGRESGRWTDGDGVRLASNDKPRLGAGTFAAIALQAARRIIEAYRSENGLRDLFGYNSGTVAVTTIDDSNIFGSNSRSPTYTSVDYRAAERMRDTLVEKYPEVMEADKLGARPNDALFHAEATVLLRAARANGDTLAGKTLEVYVDRPMCWSCNETLPLVGRELGNPTVTFIGPKGSHKTMRDGVWIGD